MYPEWLKLIRANYAATQRRFDHYVFPIYGAPPNPRPFNSHELELPSELPRIDKFSYESSYIIDLDRETFTLDNCNYFPLRIMPQGENFWELIGLEETESPDLALPEPVQEVGYPSRIVVSMADTGDLRKRWLMRVMAEVAKEFREVVNEFRKQWEPKFFPFRELTFALL
jgi:hypothetical protein